MFQQFRPLDLRPLRTMNTAATNLDLPPIPLIKSKCHTDSFFENAGSSWDQPPRGRFPDDYNRNIHKTNSFNSFLP